MKKELILNLLNLSNNYSLIGIKEEEVRGKMGLVIDVDFNMKRISFGLRDVNTYINKVSSLIVPIHLLPHLLT